MGQVASNLVSRYWVSKPKQEERNLHFADNKTSSDGKFIEKRKYFKDAKLFISNFDSSSFSLGCHVTPRKPLKRTRRESPTVDLLDLPLSQFLRDIVSPPKKAKIDIMDFIDYPFLSHLETVDYYRQSKIMIILRGLPGAGKTTIAKHLEKKYCSLKVCSADHFFMKDGEYIYNKNLIKEAHAECHRNAVAAVQNQVHVVVIDNSNLKLWEMKFYLKLADEFNYVPVTVEPQTSWSRDVSTLASKNVHHLDEETIQWKHDYFQELLPIYFGWFINEKDSISLLELGQHWIEEAYKISEFKGDFQYYTETSTLEELIDYYKKPGKGCILHVTAKYVGKQLTSDNQKYIENKEVKSTIGKSLTVSVVGFVLTPRTLGARIRLSKEQLLLWAMDDDEEVPVEFWEVERPDEISVTEEAPEEETAGEEAELSLNSTGTLNGSAHLPNGNGELPSDSEEMNHDATSQSPDTPDKDKMSSASDEDEIENGTELIDAQLPAGERVNSSDPVGNGQDEGSNTEGEDVITNEQNTFRNSDCTENKRNLPSKTHSPSKSSKYKPRKGTNSPQKQAGVPIPDNYLDTNDSSAKRTWAAFPTDIPANMKFTPTTAKCSRAHITLGCAPKVKAVTTGLDLIMAVKKEGIADDEASENALEFDEKSTNDSQPPHEPSAAHKNNISNGNFPMIRVSTFAVSGGVIRNYGNGVWVFYPEEVFVARSVFSMVS